MNIRYSDNKKKQTLNKGNVSSQDMIWLESESETYNKRIVNAGIPHSTHSVLKFRNSKLRSKIASDGEGCLYSKLASGNVLNRNGD